MNRSHIVFPEGGEKELTVREAFGALAIFVEEYWIRDGRPDDTLLKLLSWVAPVHSGAPADPAMWEYWIEAVERHRQSRS